MNGIILLKRVQITISCHLYFRSKLVLTRLFQTGIEDIE